ncbi:hypothetical protein A2368_04725 [Candidatus Collierbacteria bacterium RIFOXYB1_FULL_49_13]|uniref:Uncharacterized protein n=1 Tax=Candidatus Collierbacteria bacterium RIFOXYB1_FULL_49_13 TaxID=1817728 RepID=A0A1F5FK03_9BACT|nr:MAG: hypothetical protein A2368_04725 [Candidatus Collierbacteria bacterium RIFOXYB1_FULL_49_13]
MDTAVTEKALATEANKSVIVSSVRRILEVGTKPKIWSGEKIKGAIVPNDVGDTYAAYYHDEDLGVSILAVKDRRGKDLCSRSMMVASSKLDGEEVVKITGDISTKPAVEGWGMGSALMSCTNEQVSRIARDMRVADGTKFLYMVTDNARGAGSDKKRLGWTSSMMQRLGFTNDYEVVVRAAVGSGEALSEEEARRTWVRVYQYDSKRQGVK